MCIHLVAQCLVHSLKHNLPPNGYRTCYCPFQLEQAWPLISLIDCLAFHFPYLVAACLLLFKISFPLIFVIFQLHLQANKGRAHTVET